LTSTEISRPSYFETFKQQLAQQALDQDQWDSLLSLSLKGLARSTDGAEGVINYGEYVFGYRPAAHHVEMLEWIIEHLFARRHGVVLEPRGAAKTTWGNTILLTWLTSMFPNLRVGLLSNTSKQSNDFSRAIRYTYEANTRHQEIFGFNVSPNKWTDVEWLHKDSKWHGSKDVTLYSQGVNGAILSKRFDVLLCDDILDEENAKNPEVRETVENWFLKVVWPCLVPDGVAIVIGTRWAEEDLYEKLFTPMAQGGKGWDVLRVQALTEKDGELESYWPEQWPVWKLQEMRRDLGSALFMCAYQNDIRGLMEGNVFATKFQYFETLPAGHTYTIRMGVDLASSEKERADFTARVITAQDELGNYYVLAAYRDKRETGHAAFVADGFTAFPETALVIVESQQFQSTLIQEVMRDYPHIPIEGKKADSDKVTRARAVAAKYEGNRVWHHQNLADSDFEHELRGFPKGHDDFVDALGYSMDLGGGGLVFASVRR
jgi:predicted phage terminase large subunit-like protein